MLQSFWTYLRLTACDAILSGVEDAVRQLEQGRSPDDFVQASERLMERLARAAAKRVGGEPVAPTASEGSPPNTSPRGGKGSSPQHTESSRHNQPTPSLLDPVAGHLGKREEPSPQPNRGRGKPAHGSKS